MAKIVLHVTLVNGSDFSPREIDALELKSLFVGDDLRPPASGIHLEIYTDDSQRVSFSIPPDGVGECHATVEPWDGSRVRADAPGPVMKVVTRQEIVNIIGEPTGVTSGHGLSHNVAKWDCGCRGYPDSGSVGDPDSQLDEWVQCPVHRGLGAGPLRHAPVRFGFD